MSKLIRILLASLALGLSLGAGSALAQDEAGLSLVPAPVDRLDDASLQRGARDFVNYCLTCHTAKYMRYNRLEDIGLTPVEITDNLMFATKRIGDQMTVAMTAEDATKWFPAPPPDLTLEARIRGRDWLYSYLLGFYRDEKSASGWNNLVFPNVSMPNVLWQLSGTNKLVETEYEEHAKAAGAAIATKGLSMLEEKPGGKYAVLTLAPDVPGTMTRTEYEAFVGDLVNYLDYMGEPIKNKRIHLGIIVLLFLGVLFAFAYALKREYWKDLH
jgi:ubiquinol-cytochrome c reductase cytochrome c1 subunit